MAESSEQASKATSKFLASITFILLHLSFFCRGATVCGDSYSSIFVCIAEFCVSYFRFYYSFVIRILETEKIAFVGVVFEGTVKLGGIEQAKLLIISSNHIYFLL